MERPDDCVAPDARKQLEQWIPLARPIGPDLQKSLPYNPADEFLLPSVSKSEALKDVFLFGLFFIPCMLIGEVAMVSIYDAITLDTFATDEERGIAMGKAVLFPAIIWRVLVSSIVAIWLVRRRGASLRTIGLTTRSLGINSLLGLAAFGVIVFGTIFFALLIKTMWPGLDREFEENAELILDAVPRITPLAFGVFSLAIGYYEELIFRGVLLPRLRRATGSWILAVMFTTMIFSGLHLVDQAAAALLAITALSLIFSIVTIWRRSLVPAIIAHALFDWMMFLQLYYLAGDRWK